MAYNRTILKTQIQIFCFGWLHDLEMGDDDDDGVTWVSLFFVTQRRFPLVNNSNTLQ